MWGGVCTYMWVCALECRCRREQKRALDTLELELQAVVDPGIRTWILCESNAGSTTPQPRSFCFLVPCILLPSQLPTGICDCAISSAHGDNMPSSSFSSRLD